MALAISAGVLVAAGVYLLVQRGMLRIVLGFVLISHAVNLLIFSAGGISRREEPMGDGPDPATTADPLPQAFVLTAIVIAFAITVYMVLLAVVGRGDDDTADTADADPSGDTDGAARIDGAAPTDGTDGTGTGMATEGAGRTEASR